MGGASDTHRLKSAKVISSEPVTATTSVERVMARGIWTVFVTPCSVRLPVAVTLTVDPSAGAVARTLLIAAAAKQWRVDPAVCRARHGAVSAGSRRLSYGQLVDEAAAVQLPRKTA